MLNQPSTASKGATVLKEITVDLSSAKTASALDLGDIKTVSAFVVRSLTGSAKIGMNGYYVTVAAGEAREGLEASSLTVTTLGSTGGTMTLELRGRK